MKRCILFTTQKNEGPFLVEWLAYHRVIGFTHAVIVSNDCDDGSDALLDALADHISLDHLQHAVAPGENAQRGGEKLARDRGMFEAGDWVCWLDLDEFLNIHLGAGRLDNLISKMGNARAVVINWRLFGSAGVQKWPGMQLDPRFDRCGTSWHKAARYCKTLFRYGDEIECLFHHRPQLAESAAGTDAAYWINCAGDPLPDAYVTGRRASGPPDFRLPIGPRYDYAQINHYMVRIRQLYALRQARGRGWRVGEVATRKGRRYTWLHYQKHNCNILRDRSIQRHLPAVKAEMARLLSNPRVAEAHRAVLAASGLSVSPT